MPDDGDIGRPMQFFNSMFGFFSTPLVLFREKIVEPLKGAPYPYYHEKFPRVPTIDECELNNEVQFWEANEQFKRDRHIDSEVLIILRQRDIECKHYYGHEDSGNYCKQTREDYENAAGNWFTKYGDIGPSGTVRDAYMKQKHRLIWERRHGPVGSGMKPSESLIQ